MKLKKKNKKNRVEAHFPGTPDCLFCLRGQCLTINLRYNGAQQSATAQRRMTHVRDRCLIAIFD